MTDTSTTDGEPVHELCGLHEGDTVVLDDRPKPLTVTDTRTHHARLVGPQGGEHVITDWMSCENVTGEFRTSDGCVAEARCIERADGSEPDTTVGQEIDRTTPTGGLPTAFVSGSDL